MTHTGLSQAVQALQFVLLVPTEYLDKPTRSVISQMALVADVLLAQLNTGDGDQVQNQILLRTLLFRIMQESGNSDLLVGCVVTSCCKCHSNS